VFLQYFKAARKITEDIYEKQLKSRLKRGKVQSRTERTTERSMASLKVRQSF